MTSKAITDSHSQTDHRARQSIVADLAFWSLVGAAVAALSGPLGHWWNVPPEVLLVGGLAFLVAGVAALAGLSRRRLARQLVTGFGVFNLVFAPAVWVTALAGWLPLSGAGNEALTLGGVVALALGAWQLSTLRRAV